MYTQTRSTGKRWLRLMLILPVLVLMIGNASAQTTAFTYQGKITDNSNPANGEYDFQFTLFDTATVGTGTQQGSTMTVPAVQVAAGIFTAQLDFEAGVFDGSARFLEIGIRPAGSVDPYTVLSPRQPISSSPYAVRSATAGTADIATNATQLGGLLSSGFIQNTTSQQGATNFNVGGTGTANILDATTQFNLGGSRIMSNAGTNNLLTGIGAGLNNTTGSNNAFVGFSAGQNNTTGGNNSFFGSTAGRNNTTGFGNSFFGNRTGQNNTSGAFDNFFGIDAGFSNTTGGSNSFFGASAGRSNTTGSENSFFGLLAGGSSTTGDRNSFFGSTAGISNGGGAENAFFGYGAGSNNTIGSRNSFFGVSAGVANTSGIFNVFLGDTAGAFNTTGTDNTFVGRFAGNPNASTQVNNSVAIGSGATVSTSNTIVLGTSAETTKIPGKVVMGGGAVTGGGVTESFDIGTIQGLFTGNLILYGFNNLLASPVHVCAVSISLGGGFGGDGLTRCTSALSSERYKTDLQPFLSGLEVINRLKPVTFKWKDGGGSDFGLNAEDVAEAEPALVTRNDKGEVEDVKNESMIVVFINAFKQQQSQMTEQREHIKQQQNQIEALKKLVCADHPNADVCK